MISCLWVSILCFYILSLYLIFILLLSSLFYRYLLSSFVMLEGSEGRAFSPWLLSQLAQIPSCLSKLCTSCSRSRHTTKMHNGHRTSSKFQFLSCSSTHLDNDNLSASWWILVHLLPFHSKIYWIGFSWSVADYLNHMSIFWTHLSLHLGFRYFSCRVRFLVWFCDHNLFRYPIYSANLYR